MNKRHIAHKHIADSAIVRLIIVLVLFLVPVDILTLTFSYQAVRRVESQISADSKTALELNMLQIDYALERFNQNMYYLTTQDGDFAQLTARTVLTDEELRALTRLSTSLSDMRVNYPWLGTIYAYFPALDYFIDSKKFALYNADCKDYVRALVQEGEPAAKWQLCEIGGMPMLLRVMRYKNAYCGAWVPLAEFRASMGLDTTENLLILTNDSAALQAGAGEALLSPALLVDGASFEHEGEKTVSVTARSKASELVLLELLPRANLHALTRGIRVLQVVALFALLAVPVLLVCLYLWIAKPVNRLSKAIVEIDEGNMDYRIENTPGNSEFDRINRSFNEMMDQVNSLKISVYEQELERNSIRMRYLSQQIQPHFILNALNIIYSLEADEYPLIQDMVLCLSKYFRYIVKANSLFVYLQNEFEHIENYFHIQKARYPERFRYEIRCESGLEHCLIPPLLVQNFAENTIKHSISGENLLHIFLTAESRENDTVLIRLRDTGAGVSDEILEKLARFRISREPQEGLGLGFQNSVERLMVLYENHATLSIGRGEDDRGTVVEIVIPRVIEELSEEELA